MDRSVSSFIKREQQPIFIGILLFAALAYPCHSYFADKVRHGGNRQEAQYPELNSTCIAFINPSGWIRAGKPAQLEIDEIWQICDRQPSLPGFAGATIRKVNTSLYEVSFAAQKEGLLQFSFQDTHGGLTPYIYRYKADPPPIAATLLEVVVLGAGTALLIVLLRNRIRAAKEELRRREAAAALEAPPEALPEVAAVAAESSALFGVTEPVWLEPTVGVLTQFGKLAASVTAIVYIAGIFVVNAYLGQWGASDYSLLKPRALLAGLWFLLFLALSVIPMRVFFGKFLKAPPRRENDGTVWFLVRAVGIVILRILGFIFALFFSAIPLIVLSGFLFMNKEGGGDLDGPETIRVVCLLLGAQFVGSMIGETVLHLVRWRAGDRGKKEEVEQAVTRSIQLVGFLLFFAFMFARNVYFKIPDAYGGGGVHQEFITFKDLDDQTSAILQKDPKCVGTNSGTYNVTFSGDSYILLACTKSGQIFRLDRKYIVAESWPQEESRPF